MTLDTKELTMDIPERYRSFASYRTTLGHKANHAFSPAANTDFRIVRHPLLGPICCLGTCLQLYSSHYYTISVSSGHQSHI